MSDMIEDYPRRTPSSQMKWTPRRTAKILSELEAEASDRRPQGRVRLRVRSVRADAELANNIGRFWEAYSKGRRRPTPEPVPHVLLHWPPPTSCRPRLIEPAAGRSGEASRHR